VLNWADSPRLVSSFALGEVHQWICGPVVSDGGRTLEDVGVRALDTPGPVRDATSDLGRIRRTCVRSGRVRCHLGRTGRKGGAQMLVVRPF
jgi:hypothetical protein